MVWLLHFIICLLSMGNFKVSNSHQVINHQCWGATGVISWLSVPLINIFICLPPLGRVKPLPQALELKYLLILFRSDEEMECEMKMQALLQTVYVKIEVNRKAKLSLSPSVYVPTVTGLSRALGSEQKN